MELAFITTLIVALGVIVYLASMLRGAQRDLREVATEAILASRAHSAEELAQASSHAHWMKLEREQGIQRQAPTHAEPAPEPNTVMLADGKVLNIIKPYG